MDFILRNAAIVTPGGIVKGDLGILDGKIAKIGKIGEKGKMEKDCTGLFILPGAIDMHVHFRDPGFPQKEDFGTGSAAAVSGGVTTVVDMPNTNPPTITCTALEEKRKIAQAKSICNYGFYFGLTDDNLNEIAAAKNIAGVKVYAGSSTGNLLVQNMAALEDLFKTGKFVIVHAEEESIIRENAKKYAGNEDPSVHSLIRSPEAAYESVKKVLHLAKKCDARVHITHVSTAGEVELLRKFRSEKITADCTPHHLFLSQSAYGDRGNFVKINPPLRTNEDRTALWQALKQDIISVVATDHAPHTKKEKEQPYSAAPSGVPGVEFMLPLLLDAVNHGQLNLEEVVRVTSQKPAELLGLKTKGRIISGLDADIIVVDMNIQKEIGRSAPIVSKCGWSPYSGWKLKGWPIMTFLRGQVICENGVLVNSCKGAELKDSFSEVP